MADADVDDDEVFSWSGSCREYVKVTKELLAWSVPISERMKELVTPRWLNHYEKDIRNPAEETRMLVEPKTLELQDKIKALGDELTELDNKAEQQEKRGAEIMLAEMDREAKRARVLILTILHNLFWFLEVGRCKRSRDAKSNNFLASARCGNHLAD